MNGIKKSKNPSTIEERQEYLRERLMVLLRNNPLSIAALSRSAELSRSCIKRFLDGGEVQFLSMVRLEKYIDDLETRNNKSGLCP